MRRELKEISESNQWVYGLSEEDFDFTLRAVQEFKEAREERFHRYAEQVRKEDPQTADDILDDTGYYMWIDVQYLWH